MAAKPTPERVAQVLRYDDGAVYWRNPNKRQKPGPLGCPAGHGRRLQMPVDGCAVYVHHVVWVLHHGTWPTGQLDHANGDKLDNRIENLRSVTATENAQNKWVRGISFDRRKAERPWRARIMVGGRSISLGYYDTEADALAEYQRAKLVYHQAYATGIAAAAA